jgi:NAD(P)-dependent dehydrogenase (short-subunit alcohol dehydrogenase family)
MRLKGKLGIVTAAASGMGRAGALRFAREGAAVAVVDVNAEGAGTVASEIRKAGGKAIELVGDLRDDAFSRGIVQRTAKEFGGLDFVWNHVGHPGPAAVEGIDLAEFERAIDLNIRTVGNDGSRNPRVAATRWWRSTLHRLDRRYPRLVVQPRLFHREVRSGRICPCTRQAIRAREDTHQRGVSWNCRHADAAGVCRAPG